MLQLLENFIREYGLWAVVLGVMIEGELTLLFAGVLSHYGLFSFSEVFLCGTLGGFVSDSLGYLIGHTCKRPISQAEFIKRAQPRLEKLCQRFGIYSIFLVKYIYGMRTASAVFWGFAQMRYRRFAPLTMASCMLWVGLMAGIGNFFSEAIELMIGRIQRVGIILLVALIIAFIVATLVYLIEWYWVVNQVPELGILGLRDSHKERFALSKSEAEIIPLRRRQRKIKNKSQAA